MFHLTWIVPLAFLIFFFASPRYRGDIAQSRVRRILAQGLEKNRYTILNDVVVPAGGGTVRIDHLVVSKFGIFVIESVYARGWISGTDVQERWKQDHLGRSSRFDNPLHKARLQAEALQALLHLPGRVFHQLVVITGHRGFKRGQPAGVLVAEKLISSMRKRAVQELTAEKAAAALKGIESARLQPTGGFFVNRLALLRVVLFVALLAGIWLAFGTEIRGMYDHWFRQSGMTAEETQEARMERWEKSLRCAWSQDTGRCACYEPGGKKAGLELEKCRELAERGSVLKQ